jgi:hypothetical protein
MHQAETIEAAKMRRRRHFVVAGAIMSLVAVGMAGTYWAARQPPRFYREAITASTEESSQRGEQFERAALELHNSVQHAGRWEFSVSADEINGWLSAELPAKFPELLPAEISDPRVAIDGETLRVAIHYQRGGVDTVLSVTGEVYLTAQANEIAIRLDNARAGLVPIPLGRLIQEIDERAERAQLNLRWTEVKGSPVALVRLALDSDRDKRRVVVDRFDTIRGRIVVAGRTELLGTPVAAELEPATAGQPDRSTRQR